MDLTPIITIVDSSKAVAFRNRRTIIREAVPRLAPTLGDETLTKSRLLLFHVSANLGPIYQFFSCWQIGLLYLLTIEAHAQRADGPISVGTRPAFRIAYPAGRNFRISTAGNATMLRIKHGVQTTFGDILWDEPLPPIYDNPRRMHSGH